MNIAGVIVSDRTAFWLMTVFAFTLALVLGLMSEGIIPTRGSSSRVSAQPARRLAPQLSEVNKDGQVTYNTHVPILDVLKDTHCGDLEELLLPEFQLMTPPTKFFNDNFEPVDKILHIGREHVLIPLFLAGVLQPQMIYCGLEFEGEDEKVLNPLWHAFNHNRDFFKTKETVKISRLPMNPHKWILGRNHHKEVPFDVISLGPMNHKKLSECLGDYFDKILKSTGYIVVHDGMMQEVRDVVNEFLVSTAGKVSLIYQGPQIWMQKL